MKSRKRLTIKGALLAGGAAILLTPVLAQNEGGNNRSATRQAQPVQNNAEQDGNRRPGPPPTPEERAVRQLTLTAAQQTKVKAILDSQREQLRAIHVKANAQIEALLSPEQLSQWQQMKPPPPGPDGDFGGPDDGPPPFDGDGNGPPPMFGEMGMQDEDHGRPVALVARDLGVTPEQFRQAFKKVHPARPGERPTQAQRQANRKALSQALGVSPERLDEVMDKYRPGGRGDNGPEPQGNNAS